MSNEEKFLDLINAVQNNPENILWDSISLRKGIAKALDKSGALMPPVTIGQELWDIHYNKPRRWEVVFIGYNGEEYLINLVYNNRNNFQSVQIADRYINRIYFYSKEDVLKALGNTGGNNSGKK